MLWENPSNGFYEPIYCEFYIVTCCAEIIRLVMSYFCHKVQTCLFTVKNNQASVFWQTYFDTSTLSVDDVSINCLVMPDKTGKVERKAKIRNRFNQVPYLTLNTIWESDKSTRKHNTQESQEVSHFPAGDPEAARKRHVSITKINTKHK